MGPGTGVAVVVRGARRWIPCSIGVVIRAGANRCGVKRFAFLKPRCLGPTPSRWTSLGVGLPHALDLVVGEDLARIHPSH